MSSISHEMTLAEIVTRFPATARVLEGHELDYCCGGQRSLADACQNSHVDLSVVTEELKAASQNIPHSECGNECSRMTLTELCEHIEFTHHRYLRSELPRLQSLLEKVVFAHGERHPELRQLVAVFKALVADLLPHMMKEEQVLFPAIRRMADSRQLCEFSFGTIGNPIRMMEQEHDAVGELLRTLRSLTGGYRAPSDACASWQQLFSGLHDLEKDLHLHIHKENNVLFPAAASLEAETRR